MQNETSRETEFEGVYILYFARMKRFACHYVLSEEDAENIVQDVFSDLWEKWELLGGKQNHFAYLLLAVKNRCIDLLRRRIVSRTAMDKIQKDATIEFKMQIQALESFAPQSYEEDDLMEILKKAIDELPNQCREVFLKSKIEGKKHKEIAEEMQISVNTIETQMGIAYKKLRDRLKDLFPIVFLFLPF